MPEVSDWENFLINAEAGISTDITKAIQLTVLIQDTYDNVPAPGRKEDDVKLVAGVSYKF